MALYQCVCGRVFSSKTMALAHVASRGGSHVIKRVG